MGVACPVGANWDGIASGMAVLVRGATVRVCVAVAGMGVAVAVAEICVGEGWAAQPGPKTGCKLVANKRRNTPAMARLLCQAKVLYRERWRVLGWGMRAANLAGAGVVARTRVSRVR